MQEILLMHFLGKCEKIPVNATWGGNSIPKAGIFDEDSSTFDSDSPYELLTIKKHFLSGQDEDQKKKEFQTRLSQTEKFQEKYKKKMKNELRKRQSTATDQSNGPRQPDDEESQLLAKNGENRDELDDKISKMDDKDLKMKLDHEFTDRHLFSQLCYRNFAHLPDMTFIESVQRVVSPGVRVDNGSTFDPLFHTEMDGECLHENYEPREMKDQAIFGLDKIEKEAANYDLMKDMGVLWSITKLFTCERNFSGKKLLRFEIQYSCNLIINPFRTYKTRLGLTMAISLVPFFALLVWRIIFEFEEIAEIIRCVDETDSQERF